MFYVSVSQVRAIAGLWPIPEGSITVPCPDGSNRPGLKEVFIVPQVRLPAAPAARPPPSRGVFVLPSACLPRPAR